MSKLAYHVAHYKQGQIGAIGGHNWQHREDYDTHSNPDIDPERSKDNIKLLIPSSGSLYLAAKARIQAACTGRITSASNWISETITYPPENIDRSQLRQYFQDVLSWHQQTFGKENVLAAVVHLDETTPHLHLDLVPLTSDGRLSAKSIFTRLALVQQHTSLADFLKDQGWDIQRGEKAAEGKTKQALTVKEYKRQAEATKRSLSNDLAQLQEAKAEAEAITHQAKEKASEAHREAREAQKELTRLNASLNEIRPSQAVQAVQTKNTLTGKVLIAKQDYETLRKEAEASRAAVRQAERLRQENASLKRQDSSHREELQQLKIRLWKMEGELQRLRETLQKICARVTELWEKLVQPLNLLFRNIWTFSDAEKKWETINQTKHKECIAAAPEIKAMAETMGGERAMYSVILAVEGFDDDQAQTMLNQKFPEPERNIGWDFER